MFQATLLGHHCWLFSSERARILVDPLFHDRFGFTDSVELRVHPPRRISLSEFPPLDAVILTHEHEGHFDIASFNCLDRKIPVHVSCRSSVAARQFLKELGFSVGLMEPGKPLEFEDLVFHPMTADQTQAIIEEWDVFPYLVWDKGGDGSFFTNVDMHQTDRMWQTAQKLLEKPGLWAHTNNDSSWHFASDWQEPTSMRLRSCVADIVQWQERISAGWSQPEGILVVGGGFAFGGRQAWLNRNAFLFENWDAAEALRILFPRISVLAPIPGQRITMKGGKIAGVEERTPFAAALPREQWPSRRFEGDVGWLESYEPACGRKDFPESELKNLQEELDRFAAHLYGGGLFKTLYSLSEEDLKGRKPAFALSLKADPAGGAYVLEYEPQSCSFVPREEPDPVSRYLGVYECWATDLLAFFRAEISVVTLSFARSRSWNANPKAFQFNLNPCLFEYVHPLRHPGRFLELYRGVLSRLPEAKAKVPSAKAAPVQV